MNEALPRGHCLNKAILRTRIGQVVRITKGQDAAQDEIVIKKIDHVVGLMDDSSKTAF